MQRFKMFALPNSKILKIWLANAKNIKKLHCQCKLGKKTRQINAKNKKKLVLPTQKWKTILLPMQKILKICFANENWVKKYSSNQCQK